MRQEVFGSLDHPPTLSMTPPITGSSYLRWGNAGHAGEADAVI